MTEYYNASEIKEVVKHHFEEIKAIALKTNIFSALNKVLEAVKPIYNGIMFSEGFSEVITAENKKGIKLLGEI